MSTIKHPVGPQSSTVYWRRRLVVGLGLLLVLALLILIVSLIVRPAAGNGGPGSAPTSSATATDAAAPDPAAGPAACDPASVQVEAITDAVTYEPGAEPLLSLSVTNIGTEPCVLNAGTTTQIFTVSSGSDVYWTSTDCQQDPADVEVTLTPGKPLSSGTPIAWDRTRSNPETCGEASREAAPAGGAAYNLSVSIGGVETATPKQFLLS